MVSSTPPVAQSTFPLPCLRRIISRNHNAGRAHRQAIPGASAAAGALRRTVPTLISTTETGPMTSTIMSALLARVAASGRFWPTTPGVRTASRSQLWATAGARRARKLMDLLTSASTMRTTTWRKTTWPSARSTIQSPCPPQPQWPVLIPAPPLANRTRVSVRMVRDQLDFLPNQASPATPLCRLYNLSNASLGFLANPASPPSRLPLLLQTRSAPSLATLAEVIAAAV